MFIVVVLHSFGFKLANSKLMQKVLLSIMWKKIPFQKHREEEEAKKKKRSSQRSFTVFEARLLQSLQNVLLLRLR
ncbi:hypothetical protein RchiOBHm_Chr7g0202751 [Rosa chinensis]|uniref:Uncharacterized protein n=1 Tax=Rosa chinensis TaxID=74649 RepID=A0A2P6P8A1_ROSCH|nr:hypothetical protein RchiOBHm_Chr7g0202751 [Rosa chinensis]